ncbi:hypothetical protein D6817_01105 [Candidatus Pacearchaeota archaeon]|nr:MAG: hypothetical protein D6817_01105 [Candidatus Pacearchaeota archaeon]
MQKKVVWLIFLVAFGFAASVVWSAGLASAALGISPALKEFNFEPGKTITLNYRVTSDKPDQEIELVVGGDLADYVTLDKKKLVGGGDFSATIRLPEKIDKPGWHAISIGAHELPSEQKFIGTSINIDAKVKIFVPFPGKYIEPRLNIPNGNVNTKIPVELEVINRGTQDLTITPTIRFIFLAENKEVEKFEFKPLEIKSGQKNYFRKFLDTTGFAGGNYLAKADIDYSGEQTSINTTFIVGTLFVEIVDFTHELNKSDSLEKFEINVRSNWGEKIEGVFAEVNISNSSSSEFFRTSPTDLEPWGKGVLEWFLDTRKMSNEYNVKVKLRYAGKESEKEGTLRIMEIEKRSLFDNQYLVYGGIAAVGFVLILALIIVFFARRKRKGKEDAQKGKKS